MNTHGKSSKGHGETKNLSFSTTLEKIKGKPSAPGLVCYRIKRGYTSFRILHKREQEAWSRHIHKRKAEKGSESLEV